MTESALQKRVLEELKSEPGVRALRLTESPYLEAGTPDLLVVVEGRAVFVELKVEGEKPTPLQAYRGREWASVGALVGVARSLDEVLDLIDRARLDGVHRGELVGYP